LSRITAILVLILLALPALSFTQGAQLTPQRAEAKVREAPDVSGILSNPTAEADVAYRAQSDSWRVAVRDTASGRELAYLTVADDSGRVTESRVLQSAREAELPTLSEEEAIKLAKAEPKVQAELARHDSHTSSAEYEEGEWTVHFYDGKDEIVEVQIEGESWEIEHAYTGAQVQWQMARGENGAYGKQANYWYVWGPMALLFALAFVHTDRLFSLRNLDVVAMLGFLVSHAYFRDGIVFQSVILWYPPLIYLLVRTLLMGFGVGERVEKTSNFPTWLLFGLGALAAGLVLGLNLDSRVIDVGYAGVAGADRILDGTLPYGNMPDDVGTGDTYGPLNYLLYIPSNLIFGYSGEWDFLPSAHAITITAFLVGALALLVAGRRLSGWGGAGALLFAWAIFPYTLYSANNNTNDIIVAAILAVGLAVASFPAGRGAAVAAGFATKLFPLALGPLWLSYNDGLRPKKALWFLLGGAAVILLSFWVLALDGSPVEGIRLFYERTMAYQSDRQTPWTIFTQVPALGFLQQPLLVAVIVLGFVVAFVPQKKTMRRLAALSAAVVIAFQLTVNYWFYPYVTWIEPFVFMALLLESNPKTVLDSDPVVSSPVKKTERSEE
jgi:hypothetical protein